MTTASKYGSLGSHRQPSAGQLSSAPQQPSVPSSSSSAMSVPSMSMRDSTAPEQQPAAVVPSTPSSGQFRRRLGDGVSRQDKLAALSAVAAGGATSGMSRLPARRVVHSTAW